jgi:hypothetical protein
MKPDTMFSFYLRGRTCMLVPLFVISFRQLILNLLVWKRKKKFHSQGDKVILLYDCPFLFLFTNLYYAVFNLLRKKKIGSAREKYSDGDNEPSKKNIARARHF